MHHDATRCGGVLQDAVKHNSLRSWHQRAHAAISGPHQQLRSKVLRRMCAASQLLGKAL